MDGCKRNLHRRVETHLTKVVRKMDRQHRSFRREDIRSINHIFQASGSMYRLQSYHRPSPCHRVQTTRTRPSSQTLTPQTGLLTRRRIDDSRHWRLPQRHPRPEKPLQSRFFHASKTQNKMVHAPPITLRRRKGRLDLPR